MVEINFPNSPADKDRFESFVYDATLDVWNLNDLESINDIGDVNVLSPADKATLLFNEASQEWTDGPPAVFTGQVFAFVGSSAPSGYLLCDGSVVSQTTYSDLYSIVGILYNTGSEGAGNFRLPNLKGRIPVGFDNGATWADFRPIGKTGGEKAVTLNTTQIPSHNHTQLSHNHIQNSHDHTQPSHSHTINQQFYPSGWEAGNYGTGFFGSFRGRVIIQSSTGIGSDGRAPAIQNTTATNQNTTAVNQNAGGGQPHNNLQPYVVVQYIIKT